ILDGQADLSGADALETKEEKGRYVFETLLSKARETQPQLLRWLEEGGVEHRQFYIVNAILVKGSSDIAIELAARDDVARIEGNPQLQGIQPVSPDSSDAIRLSESQETIE